MTDGNPEEVKETGDGAGKPVPEDEKKFSQKELDAMISKRLSEERARREREDQAKADEAAEKARIAAMEGEDKVRAEWAQERKQRDAELAELKHRLAVSRAEGKLAEASLPKEFASNLIGEDDDATDANIARFSEAVSKLVATKVSENLNRGTPPAGQGAGPTKADDMDAMLNRMMGL